MAPMFLLSSFLIHNLPKYESLLYGEQADAEASPEYEYNSIAVPTLYNDIYSRSECSSPPSPA